MNQPEILEHIIDSLNEAMLDDARWPDASALIDEAFGAKGSVLTLADARSKLDFVQNEEGSRDIAAVL